jgi:thiol-disulfide isomerase/thioredoxin
MRIQPGEPLTLLNIWATWCIPCRQEFPALEALQRRYAPRGLRVLAVSVDGGGDAAVRSFVAEEGATFTIGRDESGEIQRLFQTVGVPETFLIGTDGRLVWRKIGALDSTSQDVIAQIEKALGK